MGKINQVGKGQTVALDMAKCQTVQGFVPFSTANVDATYTLAVTAAGKHVLFTSNDAGAAGNSYFVTAAAGASAKAHVHCSASTVNLDTVIQYGTGGTAGNDWVLYVIPHTHGSGGVLTYQDNTNKTLTIMYEDGVSTVKEVETAIAATSSFTVATVGTSTNVLTAASGDVIAGVCFSGGTAQEYASWSSDTLTLTYTHNTTTTAQAVTAANAASGTKLTASLTGTGSSANVLVTGDAVSSSALTGGVDVSALDTTAEWPQLPGPRFTASRTGSAGDGTITVTFREPWRKCLYAVGSIKLAATGYTYGCVAGIYNATNKTITFTPFKLAATAGITEPAPASACGFNLFAIMEV